MKVALTGRDAEDFMVPPPMNMLAKKVDTPDVAPGDGEEH